MDNLTRKRLKQMDSLVRRGVSDDIIFRELGKIGKKVVYTQLPPYLAVWFDQRVSSVMRSLPF